MNRRTYLTALGAGGIVSFGDQRNDSSGVDQSDFQEVLDAVDDLGCDPTGNEPCEENIREGVGTDTLLRFPAGTYRLSGRVRIDDAERIGLIGVGDVTFVPEQGNNDLLFSFDVAELDFVNFDVDLREQNTTGGLEAFASNRLRVEDITYHGRGTHSDSNVVNAVMPACTSPDATGVVKNVTAKEGSAWGHYKGGDGRIGVWVGKQHRGRLKLADLDLREFGNNAIYASRTRGNVQVEGGYFLNNNAGSVRISGDGSYVDGAIIEIDPDKYTGPETQTDKQWFSNGIRIEQGNLGPEYKPAGVEIRNCDLYMNESPFETIGIDIWETARTVTISNTDVRQENTSPAIRRAPNRLQSSVYHPPDGPRWVRMRNVNVVGGAAGTTAVLLIDAPDSELRNCQIIQSSGQRDGIQMIQSENCLIAGGSITATRHPIAIKMPDESRLPACLLQMKNDPSFSTSSGSVPSRVRSKPVTFSRSEMMARGSEDSKCLDSTMLSERINAQPRWLLLADTNRGSVAGHVVLGQQ